MEITVYGQAQPNEQVTRIMVDNQDLPVKMDWHNANKFIEILNKGNYKGFNDWRLPTKKEQNEMYLNKDKIGGFADYYYWSSTEGNATHAWGQGFGSGNQGYDSKGSSGYVRCVRSI